MNASESNNHVDRFNAISKDYVKDLDKNLRLTGGSSQFFYESKIKHIDQLLDVTPKFILDFGCATGQFTQMLADHFGNAVVTGFDPAENCINFASEEWKDKKNLNFISHLSKIKFNPDLVIVSGVFHHIPVIDRQLFINEIVGNMASKSTLVVFEHNPFSPLTQLIVALAPVDKDAILIRCQIMKKMFLFSGLKNIEHKYISFLPPFLRAFLSIEKYLTLVPMGAQYLVVGKKV